MRTPGPILKSYELPYNVIIDTLYENNSYVHGSTLIYQMDRWCYLNCTGMYVVGYNSGRFELVNDATLFTLTWK